MQNKITLFTLSLLLGLSTSQSIWGETPALGVQTASKVVGKTVAVINNEPIFLDDLERESYPFIEHYKRTAPEGEMTQEKLLALKNKILDRLIEEKLLLQESKTKKLKVTKPEIERGIDQFKEPFYVDDAGQPIDRKEAEKKFQEQLTKEGLSKDQFQARVEEQLMKVKLIDMEVRSKVTPPKEEDARKLFKKIQKKMAGETIEVSSPEEETDIAQLSKYLQRLTGEQLRVRHILIRSKKSEDSAKRAEAKKKLESILQRIKNGEDFAFLAEKFSDEPVSKARGGDLGFIAKGDIGIETMDQTLFKMKEGEISPIIETDFGFHLVKLVERKAPHTLDYEDVADDLKNYLAQKSFTTKLEKYLKDLRSKASITVHPIQ